MKKIGFLINPVAGLGGQGAGMKGSDDCKSRENAMELGYQKTAFKKAAACAGQIQGERGARFFPRKERWEEWFLRKQGYHTYSLGQSGTETCREDTVVFAEKMREQGVDLLVFCGGDGTARGHL